MGRTNTGWLRAAFSFVMACVAAIALTGCSKDTQATSAESTDISRYVTRGNGEPYECTAHAVAFTKNSHQRARVGDDVVVTTAFAGKTVAVDLVGNLEIPAAIVGDDTGGNMPLLLVGTQSSKHRLQIDASSLFADKTTVDSLQHLTGSMVTEITLCLAP